MSAQTFNMLFLLFVGLSVSWRVSAYRKSVLIYQSAIDKVYSESNKTENDRITELEEQVAFLQELLGVQNNGTINDMKGLNPLGNLIPKDCQEILQSGYGYTEDGIYTISPDGRCPFRVYCDMTNGGWTMIQRRINGHVNFRRNWTDYVQGFGDLEGNHWLGLEKIHRLTSGGSQINFTLLSYEFITDYAYYYSFTVHDVMSGYKLNIDPYGYKGTVPELLGYHNDMKFSTFDRDNDHFSSNCCDEFGGGGGWWYNSCYRLGVLNGEYGKKSREGMRLWNNGDKYILNSVIKIKPRLGMC